MSRYGIQALNLLLKESHELAEQIFIVLSLHVIERKS